MSVSLGPDSYNGATVHCHRDSMLTIGARCWIGEGTIIHLTTGITIGDDVLISWDCLLMDTDMHSLDFAGRQHDAQITQNGKPSEKDWSVVRCLPIVIEDRAWIGARSILLPGVFIGEGAVIGAGSVVRGRIPPYSLFAGNPAQYLRRMVTYDPA